MAKPVRSLKMFLRIERAAFLWICMMLPVMGEDVQYKPLSIGALYEFGMLQGGRFSTQPTAFRDEWLDHFAAYLIQSASSGRWSVNVGVGGIFEFQKPEEINPVWGGTQNRMFFVGPAVADLEYRALQGNTDWKVGLGMFGYKYNPDASNLGEYLFRSGPYPTYIMTGGYSLVNNTSSTLQGLKSFLSFGNLKADLFLTTETTMPPLYDLSLAGVFKYSLAGGLLDLGAGVNFKRLIPIRPSRTTVKIQDNSYFLGPDGQYYSADLTFKGYNRNKATFYNQMLYDASNAADTIHYSPADSAYYAPQAQAAQAILDNVILWTTPGGAFQPDYQHYTQAGVVVDAMASLDLKKLIPAEMFGPNDLRIFVESALLGVKDYPVFYTKKSERMPVMVGINLPGFRFLDLISVQYEYFHSPNINSFESSVRSNQATPQFADGADRLLSGRDYSDGLKKDDRSWSILIKKELSKGLFFAVQAARDHARLVSKDTYAGPFFDPNEVFYTTNRNNWYWMTQFSFGI